MLKLHIQATTQEVKAPIRLFMSVKGRNGEEAVPRPQGGSAETGVSVSS